MVYLDYSNDFDKVDKGMTLHKLKSSWNNGKYWYFVINFLTDRSHFVRLPVAISEDHHVLSGVPQVTILGPPLFLILISVIDKYVSATKVISFADNTRLYFDVGDVMLLSTHSHDPC